MKTCFKVAKWNRNNSGLGIYVFEFIQNIWPV